MYCMYQDREELEDDLYQENEEDSEGSEANSELEFRLYSQLHYSSNAGEMEEQEDRGGQAEGQDTQQLEVTEKTADADGEQERTGESRPPSPNLSSLPQPLKRMGEKQNKQKQGKSNQKGQRSLSLVEEVIVIDSSPDVISISEDDSVDDDGVCTLKGQGLRRLQTSTPAQQGTQKWKRSLSVSMTVDSSSSESESEESDSSDSDGLENWMILGRGNQDGDQSISLNLEGGSDSSADVEEEAGSWLVSDRDMEAQIYNKDKRARMAVQRLSNRYYTSKNVQCRNCNKTGHLSKNCPEPTRLSPCFLCGTPGHLAIECPSKHCNNCGLPGHHYGSCSERAYWHKQCHRCSMTGHFFEACPEIWRQYHITTETGVPVKQRGEDQGRTPAYCYNCSRKGHFGHACTQRRMFNGMYPSTPFINHYDTVEDINRRKHRIKWKVKELKKSGLFPASSPNPLTPGPPKKKQKISYHKNNHQPNHTLRRSSDNKPSQSHIFFNDDNDVRASAPKTKKYKRESTGNVKPWKQKRPVPTLRDPPTKHIFDQEDDFPRGGGKGENMKKKKKAPSVPPEGRRDNRPDRLFCTVTRDATQEKREKKRRNRARRIADKKPDGQMYPRDENLFIIKQRKRNR